MNHITDSKPASNDDREASLRPLGYPYMVYTLAKPGTDILSTVTGFKVDLLHMALGIASEAGELADAIKKYCIYGAQLDTDNVIEELGDLEFYMERMRQLINIDREEVLLTNMRKLAVRYAAATYSDQAARERADKQKQQSQPQQEGKT